MNVYEFIEQHIDDRKERMKAVEAYCEEHPDLDERELDRLADYILYEELTDPHPDKMAREEYPIMSETQREERIKDEVGLKIAEEVGTDGKSYRVPKRRKRTDYENKFVNKAAKSRNKERRNKYRAFTEIQPVERYVMETGDIDAYLMEKYLHKRLI
jgi:hypothetical protein